MKNDRLKWRLYYGDGTTVTGDKRDEWDAAPPRNVVGLVQQSDALGRSVMPSDLFFWPPWLERPFGTDHWGVIDYLCECGSLEIEDSVSELPVEIFFARGIKIGRMLNNYEWKIIWKRMVNDPDFPVKSSNNEAERVPS